MRMAEIMNQNDDSKPKTVTVTLQPGEILLKAEVTVDSDSDYPGGPVYRYASGEFNEVVDSNLSSDQELYAAFATEQSELFTESSNLEKIVSLHTEVALFKYLRSQAIVKGELDEPFTSLLLERGVSEQDLKEEDRKRDNSSSRIVLDLFNETSDHSKKSSEV